MQDKKHKQIYTKRLTLRPIADGDAPDAIKLFTAPEIGETYMLPDFKSREEMLNLFNTLKRLSEAEERFVRGVYLDNRMIGFINDVEIDRDNIELGFVIHPDHKNNGYATEVLTACMDVLFDMGYSTVKTGAFEENSASLRVMEKSGMMRKSTVSELEYRGKIHRCVWFEKNAENNG